MSDPLREMRDASATADGKDPRLVELRRLASELHGEGVDLVMEGGRVVTAPPERDTEHVIEVGDEHYLKLGIVSDTHLGSQYEQLTALRDFYRRATEEGVHAFVHGGDMHQGIYKKREMAQAIHAHGSDAQVAYAAEVYPRADVPTYAITGNHDDTFYVESGTNVVKLLAARRDDIHYLGQDACYLTLDGVRLYIVHPEGGGSYAKSYKPQKLAEALPRDRDVQVALIGHYHTWGTFDYQSTIALMLPCFQGQYTWLVRKALFPTIGGIILEVWHDGDTITRVRPELVRYRERENDWDSEVSLAVQRGAV